MSDFDQFQDEVINVYREKKEKRLLPVELERPSPTQLMNYCLTLLHRGELMEDIPTLNWIFNALNKYPDLETGIKEFGPVGFRSLRNFMIGKTTKPREHIVKLLAVLIDFRPRPYEKWAKTRSLHNTENWQKMEDERLLINDTGCNQTENTAEGNKRKEKIGSVVIGDPCEEPNQRIRLEGSGWSKLKKPILYSIVAFSGMLGAYQIADSFDRECMYWETDRYIPVACGEKIEGAEIIPLDNKLVKQFRKIMQPDTLTLRSIGKAWYGKPTVDSVEFYTMKGAYPMDRRKELKPATEYIIKKYVLDKKK